MVAGGAGRENGSKGMPIELTCACGQRQQLADDLAGWRVRCPACGRELVVPGQPGGSPAAPAGAPEGVVPAPAQPAAAAGPAKYPALALGAKVATLIAYAVGGVGLAFGNYTYYAWGAHHDRSGDRIGFVFWTVLGLVYVVGSLRNRWAAIGSCLVAALGFFMFITYPVTLDLEWFWGQALAMPAYFAAFATSVVILIAGGRTPPVAPAAPGERTSRLAIVAMILSCIPIWLFFIPGIICGHVARSKIRKDPALRGMDLAATALLVGYGVLGAYAVAVIAAIAMGVWRG